MADQRKGRNNQHDKHRKSSGQKREQASKAVRRAAAGKAGRDVRNRTKTRKNIKSGKRKRPTPVMNLDETKRKFALPNRRKLIIVFSIIVALLCALIVRLNYITIKSGRKYSLQVLAQQQASNKTLPFKRGDILDRNGTVLATSEKVYNLVIDAYVILNSKADKKVGDCVEPTIAALEKYFGVDGDEVRQWIEDNPESRYKVLQKKLSYDVVQPYKDMMASEDEAVQKENQFIKGIWFEEEYIRKYPYDTLACDIIGFTNAGNVGAYGLEAYYNSELNGTDGRQYGYLTDESTLEQTTIAAVNGNNVVTTLDINVQRIIEKHIGEFMEAIGSKNTAVIVQDIKTGEILGMATAPFYNLNDTRDYESFRSYFKKYEGVTDETFDAMDEIEKLTLMQGIWKNFGVSDAYEPGSTVKLVTVASALEEHTSNPSDEFNCTGALEFEGVNSPVKCNGIHGLVDLQGALEHSCNTALMEIGLKMGQERFTKYQNLFGFGQKTNIDLPGESSGQVYSLEDMKEIDLAINAFGQTYTTTMVQVSSAISSILADGDYYRPHVVKEITSENGNLVQKFDKELVRKTVSEQTADFIKEAMRATVQKEGSTAVYADIEGYDIGGKTGTAEKLPRDDGRCLVSFVSAAPMDDPQVLVYTIVDEPNTVTQVDSRLPQILTKKIYEELLPYLQIFPEGVQAETGDAAEPGDTTEPGETTVSGETDTTQSSDTTDTAETTDTTGTDGTGGTADTLQQGETGAAGQISGSDVQEKPEMSEARKRELWAEYFPTNTNASLRQ